MPSNSAAFTTDIVRTQDRNPPPTHYPTTLIPTHTGTHSWQEMVSCSFLNQRLPVPPAAISASKTPQRITYAFTGGADANWFGCSFYTRRGGCARTRCDNLVCTHARASHRPHTHVTARTVLRCPLMTPHPGPANLCTPHTHALHTHTHTHTFCHTPHHYRTRRSIPTPDKFRALAKKKRARAATHGEENGKSGTKAHRHHTAGVHT